MVDVVVLLVVIALVWVLYIRAIVGAARFPEYAYRAIGRTKPGTITMIVLTGFIGGTYFLLRIGPALRSAKDVVTPESIPPADQGDLKEWRRTRDPWA